MAQKAPKNANPNSPQQKFPLGIFRLSPIPSDRAQKKNILFWFQTILYIGWKRPNEKNRPNIGHSHALMESTYFENLANILFDFPNKTGGNIGPL